MMLFDRSTCLIEPLFIKAISGNSSSRKPRSENAIHSSLGGHIIIHVSPGLQKCFHLSFYTSGVSLQNYHAVASGNAGHKCSSDSFKTDV